MNISTSKLALAVVILLILVYLKFYTSVSTGIKIIQLSLTDLSPQIMLQKHPIILDEKIVNPMSLLQAVFKYLYIYKRVKTSEDGDPNIFRKNTSRFLIIYSNKDNSSIEIVNPSYVKNLKEIPPFIDVKLHANMCMILPFKWYYRLPSPSNIGTIALEDLISLLFGRFV